MFVSIRNRFLLFTGHKLSLKIFYSKRSLDQGSTRLQRWASIWFIFDFDIKYVNTSQNVAWFPISFVNWRWGTFDVNLESSAYLDYMEQGASVSSRLWDYKKKSNSSRSYSEKSFVLYYPKGFVGLSFDRLVIPPHMAIIKKKALVPSYFWCPAIDKQFEECSK